MLIPDKLTDPKNCLIYYGFLISKHLKKYNKMKYVTLENYILKTVTDFSQEMFISALNFLFALGKIEYNFEKDEVEMLYEAK